MDGVWGTVCDAGFGADEAQAVCRAIGGHTGLDYDGSYHADRPDGQGWNWRNNATGPTMPIVMSQANCSGGGVQAESILDCNFTATPTDCYPHENVQVICTPPGKRQRASSSCRL